MLEATRARRAVPAVGGVDAPRPPGLRPRGDLRVDRRVGRGGHDEPRPVEVGLGDGSLDELGVPVAPDPAGVVGGRRVDEHHVRAVLEEPAGASGADDPAADDEHAASAEVEADEGRHGRAT